MSAPKLPSSVRFIYSKQAPTPVNWYTQEDYEGCLLTWTPPPQQVLGYVFVRTAERLPEDCVMRLMQGQYRGVADQVLIKRPLDAMIDDQIHERPRYLALARTADNAFVEVPLKVEKLSRDTDLDALGRISFWSNPGGPFGKGKDPRFLDYMPIRADDFSGFSWSYPDHIPDLARFELVISGQPVSAHTGEAAAIAQFRQVLQGKLGAVVPLEPFVTRLVENLTNRDQYQYFALLARDSRGGRTQIPMEHHTEPFGSDAAFRYIKPVNGAPGQNPQKMQQDFAAWREQMKVVVQETQKKLQARMGITPGAAPPSSAQQAPPKPPASAAQQAPPTPEPQAPPEPERPTPEPERPEPEPVASPRWSAVEPEQPATRAQFQDDPSYLGVQLSWDDAGSSDTRFVALRADSAPEEEVIAAALEGAIEGVDRIEFSGPVDNLVDTACLGRGWYGVARRVADGGSEGVEGLEAKALRRLPRRGSSGVYWSRPEGGGLRGRIIPVAELERARRREAPVALEFGTHDAVRDPRRVELYRFEGRVRWDDAAQARFEALQRGESVEGWKRLTIEGAPRGVRDDAMAPGDACFVAAALVDEDDNRFAVSVFAVDPEEGEGWPLLSEASPDATAAVIEEEPDDDASSAVEDDAPNLSARVMLEEPPSLGEPPIEDEIGLSTAAELDDLGFSQAPEMEDDELPDVEYVDEDPPSSASMDLARVLEDATPSDPITGLVDLAARLPRLTPEGSDVTWQRFEQQWYFSRLVWEADALTSADRRLRMLWLRVAASPPPAVIWGALEAIDALDIRAFDVPMRAGGVIDNLTEVASWFALLVQREDGGWRQLDLEQASPPWPSGSRCEALDPGGLDRIDAQVSEQLREARRHLGENPELVRQALERARTIWPDNVRILAFARANAL